MSKSGHLLPVLLIIKEAIVMKQEQVNYIRYALVQKEEAIGMRQEKIQHIRSVLVQKMDDLLSVANNAIAKMKNTDGKYADPFDQAAIETNKFVELACRDRERQLILDIKETIMRIDRGLFGICDHCGRTIAVKRLLLAPMSKMCMPCQKIMETHVKQKGGRLSIQEISYNHA
jgi:DnaK suppressor protein